MSFDNNGALQFGGGTTIYNNVFTLNSDCGKYLQMDALSNQTYVYMVASSKTTFQIIQIGGDHIKNNQVKLLSTQVNSDYVFYTIVSMSLTDAVMIGITQDMSKTSSTACVVAYKLGANNQLNFGPCTVYTNLTYSVSPQVTRLSDYSFAVSYFYFNDTLKTLATRVGTSM